MSMSVSATGSGNVQGFDPGKMASRMASKMMGDLDPNNTGSVSKDNFVSSLTAKGLSSADATKMYDSIDTKKTGSITKSDIESAIKSGSLKPPAAAPPGGAGKAHGAGGAKSGGAEGAGEAGASTSSKTYEAADTNKDGTVSSEEALIYASKSESSASTSATSALGKNVDTKV